MSSSTFPTSVDTFTIFQDISASDASNVQTYQQLLQTSNLSPSQQTQLANLTATLAGKILQASDLNHFSDAVSATQSFFLNTVNSDINNMEAEFNAKVAKFSNQGTYNPATTYMDMNFVTWNNQSYICTVDNTLNIDPSHTSNWVLIAAQGATGPQGQPGAALSYIGTYSSLSTYQANQLVSYNGSTYICTQNNTLNIPPTNTTYWTLFVTGATPLAQSTAPTSPVINQLWIDTTSLTNPLLKYWNGSQWNLVPAPATTSELGLVLMSATPQTGYPVAVSTVDPAFEQITGSKYLVAGTGLTSTPGTNSQTVTLDIASGTQLGGVKPAEGLIVDADGTLKAPWSVKGLSNVLSPSRQSFTRSTPAGQVNGNQVASNVLRLEQGAFRKAPFIEEATTNLVPNSGFNTVTGTAQVFADALISYTGSVVPAPWTNQQGSWTFGASGATSGANGSIFSAGNANWSALTGTSGQNLSLTAQATFTTPATLSSGSDGALELFKSLNTYYVAVINTSGFFLQKDVSGTGANLTSVAQAISPSTTYTITLSLDNTGHLTAKLYSGQGTGGTLLQTLTATDTSLTGGFLIGVGGDTGVIVSHAQINAPFADGWTIGGDSRVAWALTSNSINGTYSVNVVGVSSSISGILTSTAINASANTSYTSSFYVNANNVGATNGLDLQTNYYSGSGGTGTLLAQVFSANVTGTASTQRVVKNGTSPASTVSCTLVFAMGDSGSATFDMVQLEQKAYATTAILNDNATAGSTATRNADSLSYTLDKTLATRFAHALVAVPQVASTSLANRDYVLASIYNNAGSLRYKVLWRQSDGKIHFIKTPDGTTLYDNVSSAITFNAGDKIYIVTEDDQVSGDTYLYVQVNGGTLATTTLTDTHAITDAQTVYKGGLNATGSEWNGTIESILHTLATGETITTDEVTALFNASDWGLGDYPAQLIKVDANNNPQTEMGQFLAQVLSGGYKIQSGTASVSIATAGTQVSVAVTFPNPFSSGTTPLVLISLNGASAGLAGYISGDTTGETPTQFTLTANSYVAQNLSFRYVAIGQ